MYFVSKKFNKNKITKPPSQVKKGQEGRSGESVSHTIAKEKLHNGSD